MGTGPLGGKEQLISVAEAADMARRHREKNPSAVRGWGFGREAIDALLAQPGCAGIRVYRGLATDGAEQVLIVGIDANGNDLVPAKATDPGLVAERGWPCPPLCAADSLLNG